MTTVLVTGGAGYIGSHACKALAAAGYEPVSFDNLSTGHDWAVKWGPLERGDLLDRERISEAFARHRPAGVMHFASCTDIGESVAQPAKYWRNNVVGALNLLDAMTAAGVSPIVFSGSCAVYGMTGAHAIPEDEPVAPINPYGNTKLAIEQMLGDYRTAAGVRSVVMRYFNAAGADAGGETGELHEPESHLIPLAIAAAAGDGTTLRVFGSDYPTGDGTCVRDYVHVSDLADAHVRAMAHLLDGGESAAVNLGAGEGASVRQVIETVGRVVGTPVPQAGAPRRPGDPPRLVADISRARSLLGWAPGHSALDNIVRTAWDWYRGPAATLRREDGQDAG